MGMIEREIAGLRERAETLGMTAVVKMFLIPTQELRRTRCELCGRTMEVHLQGLSRPVCRHHECPGGGVLGDGKPSALYFVYPRE